jgi:eukaryotic-like serine/threonine-protein kinase
MADYSPRAKGVFQRAITLDGEERERYVTRECAGDQRLRGEVDTLLTAFSGSNDPPDLSETRPVDEASWWQSADGAERPPLEDAMIGRLIGPYRVLECIGTGGMGSVFLAERAEADSSGSLVAIKTLRPGLEDEGILRRFQIERRTLAAMKHPNIVALTDSGTSDDGRPYFVMEYVQGEPIDEYCDRLDIPIDTRLELFRSVCGAVHYAHQHLVVHRDLKPSNIRVTADGIPKLLDFGIAKIFDAGLTPGITSLTRTGVAPMTPDFASPEQVMGEAITTSTDIYALGVLLYRILAGRAPYELTSGSAAEMLRIIVETDPPRPSQKAAEMGRQAVVRRLRGDLDMIVMMALRKEAQHRYASVEQYSDDIRRHLEGLPVLAQKDTRRYRMSRFVRRHKTGVVATLFVAVALVTATVVSVNQWLHAERRFQETRSLARFVLFEFDDAIRSGVTPARKKLVTEALTYLDRLSKEAGSDLALLREVVDGYVKVGDVQGNPSTPHLGDPAGARESYRRALSIAERIQSKDPADRATVAKVRVKFGDLLAFGGNRAEALAEYRKAFDVLEQAAAASPSIENRKALLACVNKIGFTQYQVGDFTGAIDSYRRCVDIARQLESAGAADARHSLAYGQERYGEMLARSGKTEEGIRNLRAALAIYQELAAASPEDASARRDVSNTYTILGDILFAALRTEEALASYTKGLEIAETLAREDPQNRQARTDYHIALGRLADIFFAVGRRDEARSLAQRALTFLRTIVDLPDASQYDVYNYAWILVTTPFEPLRNPSAAEKYADKAVRMTDGSDPRMLDLLARAYDSAGKARHAVETEAKALKLLPASGQSDLRKELEDNLARFRSRLARPVAQ